MPSNRPFPGWDADASLEDLARQAEYLDFSRDLAPFGLFPEAAERRCWDRLRLEPSHAAAAELLLTLSRVRLEQTGDIAHACSMKQLLDAVGADSSASLSEYGNALVNVFQARLQEGMRRHRIKQSEFESNPMRAIEEAFGTDEGDSESHLLAGLVQAGYRGILADDRDVTPLAMAFGLREADHLFRAGQPALASAALEWVDRRLAALGDTLPEPLRRMLGQLYKSAALGARDGRSFDELVPLLERARSFFPARGDDHAECSFELGREYERRGQLYEAVSSYDEALGTPGLENPLLIGVIQACRGSLMADAEGDVTRLMPIDRASVEAAGHDPDFLRILNELGAGLQSGAGLPDETILDAIQVLHRNLKGPRGEARRPDHVLSMYVLMLKLGLTLERKDLLPFDFAEILAEADDYAPRAQPGTALEYDQVKAAVVQLARPDSRPPAPDQLPRLSDLLGKPSADNRPLGSSDR